MNNLNKVFENGKAFIPFITAGDPDLKSTENFILEMDKAGADLIEIGIAFSDPIAEGLVIQGASQRALQAGTTLEKLFEMVKNVRQKTDVPLAFMTYVNPVFNYGYENFFKKCQELKVEAIIVPDVPFEEKAEIETIANKYGVHLISLIAPSSKDRIEKIAKEATGFIYLVSSMGVTGVRSEIKTDLDSIVKIIRKVSNVPVAIGFGINTPEQAQNLSKISDGVIVGSAIIKLVEKYGKGSGPYIYDYVKNMKNAALKAGK